MVNLKQLLRRLQVEQATGRYRSGMYVDISRGLFPKPVKIGPRASAWPASEVQAIIGARIAGKSEDEIRELVAKLHAARVEAAL